VRLRLGLQVGLRPVDALLIDLSEQGCRLRPAQPLARGAGVRVVLGSELTGGRALALRGEVSHPAETNGEWVVRFRRLGVRRERRLAAVLDRHAGGPAALPAPVAAVEPSDAERRRSPRRPFRRRVIALGEEAARVLVGRDLSLGGMRVDPDAKLRVGESLRLAIHGGGHDEPVLVDAEVMRDEAERGYVLRFVRIPDNARRVLEAMLCEAPDVADPNTEGEAGGLVLSQIVAASP
jgi:hypothetical protein